MTENYWGTSVPVSRSADEIRKMLASFGAERFALIEEWQYGRLAVQFQFKGFPVEFGVDVKRIAEARLAAEPWNGHRRMGRGAYERSIRGRPGRSPCGSSLTT